MHVQRMNAPRLEDAGRDIEGVAIILQARPSLSPNGIRIGQGLSRLFREITIEVHMEIAVMVLKDVLEDRHGRNLVAREPLGARQDSNVRMRAGSRNQLAVRRQDDFIDARAIQELANCP